MIRLLSITSSRADVGILKPVWSALIETGRIELHVGITGMHCPNSDYVKSQIPKGAQTHQFGADIGGHYGSYVVQAMSQIQANSADLYARLRPDGILVTGFQQLLRRYPSIFPSFICMVGKGLRGRWMTGCAMP